MADVNANIGVNIDTSAALAQLKALQRQISQFHSSIARSSESAALAQKSLQKNLLGSINSIGAFSAELRTVRTSAESFTNSLEKNKFSMREYFRYAGASTKTFGKLFRSEFDTIGKVAEERVKTLQTQYIKMGRNASGAMEAIAIRPTSLNMQDYGTKTAIAAQKQALFNQLMKQGTTNLLNFGKNTQWAGRQLMVGFTIPLAVVGSTATKTFMDMEAQALKFKKVYGDLFTPKAETQSALDNITELGKQFTKYGIAVSTTVGLAAEAAAAGFQGLDLQRQTTEATRLSVLGQVDSQKALETTISLQNAFGMSSDKLADSINFLNAVENQTVVSLDDITTAIPKVAPVIQQLGGDVKDLTFFIAAMKEGGINASEGANALKSGLAALINPTTKASAMLAQFGINANEIVTKNKGNLKATVIEFATALNQLDPLNRAQAIEQMFGKFQFARLSTLFANVAKDGNQAARVLALANSSVEELSSLSEQELGMTADSAMNKFKKSVEDLKFALIPVGEAFLEAATPIIEFVGGVLEKFGNLSDGTKKLITFLTVGIGAIGPIFLMTFGLIANAIANGLKGVMLLRQGYLRLTGQSQVLGEQTQYLNTEQLEAAAAAHSLDQSHARLTQSFTAETAALQKLIAAYQGATRAGQSFMLNNPGMMMPPRGGRKLASGIVSVPGPKGAGDIVPAMLSPGEAVIPAEFAKKYAPLIQGMVAGNIPGYEMGVGSVPGSLFGTEATFSRKATASRIEQVINQLDSAVRDLVVNAVPDIAESLKGASISVESFGKELQKRIQAGSINVPKSALGGFGEKIYSAPAAIKKQTAEMDWQSRQKEEDAITEALKEYKLTLEQRNNIIGKDTAHIEQSLATGPSGEKIWDPTNLQADSRAINKYMEQAKGRMLQFANETDKVDNLVADVAKQLKMSSEAVKARFSRLAGGNQPQTTADYALLNSFAAQDVKNPKNKTPYMAAAAGAVANVRVNDPSYVEALARGDVTAYKKVVEKSTQDIYVSSRKGRQSPHPLAPKDGRDDAEAYNKAKERSLKATRSYESLYGAGAPVTSIDKSIRRQTQKSIKLKDLESSMPMSPQISSGVKATATNIKSMNDRLKSFDRGLMSSSFAVSSLAGVASMSGGKLGEMSGTIFKVTTAMFALQAVTSLLTQSGIARLTVERGLMAGLLVRATADSKAKIATGLFSGGITRILPNLLSFGKMILRFLGPIGLVISGLLALKGVVDLVNKAREKERLAIEGVGKAANITEGQLKKLGDIYGFVPTKNKFSITPTVAGVVGQQRTQVEETKDLYKNDKEFQNNVKTLRDASVKEADLIFNTMALKLLGAGATQEAIQNIIIALQEQAGRTELKFNFKNIDLNTEEGKTNFKKSIDDVVDTFSKDFAKGVKSKKSLSTASNVLAADLESIKGQLGNATIDAKTFAQSFDLISLKIKEMNEPAALILLNETLKTLNPELQESTNKIKNINDKMIILQALALGLKIEAKQIDALNAGGASADAVRAGILKGITDRINQTAAAAIQGKKAFEDLNTATTEKSPQQVIKERTKALLDQAKAYTILIAKGYDAATAADLAGDSLIAAAIATGKVKVGTKEWENLINKLKDAQLQADIVSAKIDLDKQQEDLEVQLQAYNKLISAGFDAKKAAELVDNVNFAKLILNTGKVNIKFEQLVKSINAAQLLADKLKNISDPFGLTVSRIQPIMDKFNSNHELMMEKFRIQEERAKQQFQPAIDAAEKAVQAIQDNIDATNSKFAKLLEPLETESKVLSNSLSIIDNKSKEINDNYDIQQKSLEEISDINEDIAAQEKGRLTLADALTQGDISAAAVAAQEMRSAATARASSAQSKFLDDARKKELESVKVNGLTRLDIEKRQYAISLQQYTLEQQRDTLLKNYNTQLETANTTLKNAQSALSVAIKTISDQKTAWENAKLAIDEAENSVRTMNIKLEDQLALVQKIKAAWKDAPADAAAAAVAAAPAAPAPAASGVGTAGPGGGTNDKVNNKTDYVSPYPPGTNAFNYGSGNPLSGITTKTGTAITPTTSISSVGMNLGINNPISKVITGISSGIKTATSAINKAVVNTGQFISSVPSRIVSGVVSGTKSLVSGISNIGKSIFGFGRASGGIIPKYYASGGYSKGTDTIPAMLTPGEFVIRKNAVDSFGVNNLNKINDGSYGGSSVYNYSLSVNVKSDSSPDDIARTVMTQIKRIDSQRIKTQRGA